MAGRTASRRRAGSRPEGRVTGEIDLRFAKTHAERLKRLGYRRHPQGAGWVRPLRKAWFPRFHLYAEADWRARLVRLDLHLDHTRERPDSRGPTAAADGAAVSDELARILKAFAFPA
jgi:hypothetical protein